MKNVVFFNHWHYGDLFSTRGIVEDVRRQLPGFEIGYIHTKNPDATKDLTTVEILAEEQAAVLHNFDQFIRVTSSGDTIFVNTWVGAYGGFWKSAHPTFDEHRKIYGIIYAMINSKFDLRLELNDDVWNYIPEINYDYFDTQTSINLRNKESGRFFLFCNNEVNSAQSSMGDMKVIIETLAEKYPTDTFIVTKPFETHIPNIRFTNYIFNKDNDLCEISYLSKHCDLIVGKNSGAYTYTQTRSNLSDPSKIMVCFSHNERDILTYGLSTNAKVVFSDTVNDLDAINIIDKILPDIKGL